MCSARFAMVLFWLGQLRNTPLTVKEIDSLYAIQRLIDEVLMCVTVKSEKKGVYCCGDEL